MLVNIPKYVYVFCTEDCVYIRFSSKFSTAIDWRLKRWSVPYICKNYDVKSILW